jgi:undecaprenyl pyrophosphate phosphatase UppP
MDFLKAAIDKKEKRLKRVMVENVVLAGIIGCVGGYILSEAYTACMVNGLVIQVAIITGLTAFGLAVGYFDGKEKQEELRLDLLLLRNLSDELD